LVSTPKLEEHAQYNNNSLSTADIQHGARGEITLTQNIIQRKECNGKKL